MENLGLIFQQVALWIGQYLQLCRTSWLLTVCLFLAILNLIVSVLIAVRGGK